jgi:TatD DNase family protein
MYILPRARVPIVLHCFEGGEREVKEAAERGYYLGLAGNVTYKNSRTAKILDMLDPGRVLVETDAPYLSPQPVRSKRNEPKYVVHTVRFVAERIGMGEEEFGALTSRNARDVFGLPLEA